jgi:hypothetical protein
MQPEKWGVTTQNAKHVFLHVFEKPSNGMIYIPGNFDLTSSKWINNGHTFKFKKLAEGIEIDLTELSNFDMDQILQLNKSK